MNSIEAIVLSATTTETTKAGQVRKVTFLLGNEEPGHPFAGLVGERLRLVCVKINDDETTEEPAPAPAPLHKQPPYKEPQLKRPMSLSQRCALSCGEVSFREFVAFIGGGVTGTKVSGEDAAEFVRDYCRVVSRAQLDNDVYAAARWNTLLAHYENWQRHGGVAA